MAIALPLEARLLNVAIELFGERGLEAVGTRAVAEAAGAQMSAITYYFGGKNGMYLACARHIAELVGSRITPAFEEADALCHLNAGPAASRKAVLAILGHFTTAMMQDDIAAAARFIVREQMNPTAAFTVLYQGVMQKMIQRLVGLLDSIAASRISAEELSLRAIALVGQVLTFRFAQATLKTATGWQQIHERETEAVRRAVLAHVGAVLTDLERSVNTNSASGED